VHRADDRVAARWYLYLDVAVTRRDHLVPPTGSVTASRRVFRNRTRVVVVMQAVPAFRPVQDAAVAMRDGDKRRAGANSVPLQIDSPMANTRMVHNALADKWLGRDRATLSDRSRHHRAGAGVTLLPAAVKTVR